MESDLDRIYKMRDILNAKSPSFCLAKWLQVTTHLHEGTTHSCYIPPPHLIPLSELDQNVSALHNTAYKKTQRAEMLQGERPAECEHCWKIEDLPAQQVSDRYIKSADPWAAPLVDQISSLPWDADVTPTYYEVSFSRVCNFKCSYCSPRFSTSWLHEVRKYGPYPNRRDDSNLLGYDDEESNPYVQAFWKWWPELKKTLKVFRITGGEPLLSESTFRILENLIGEPQPDLEIAVNSNLGVSQSRINRFVTLAKELVTQRKIRKLTLFTSAEAWGAQSEYIRYGMDFGQFWKNVELLLKDLPQVQVVINATFNVLSVPSFGRFIDEVLILRKNYGRANAAMPLILDLSYLENIHNQTLEILPREYIEFVTAHLNRMKSNKISSEFNWGFTDYEISKMERIVNWMLESKLRSAELLRRRMDFYLFFSEHDRRRGTDFLKTFPEFREFWNVCREACNKINRLGSRDKSNSPSITL